MSRIDVVPAEKGKFKVLINMGMDGCFVRSTVELANKEAEEQLILKPNATLFLFIIKEN